MPKSQNNNLQVVLRELTHNDWNVVRKIYEEGIATGNATFEETSPDWDSWDMDHIKHSRFVAIENQEILGWAALSPISGRCVYSGVAEVSIYVASKARGKGIGKKLLLELIRSSERHGLWMLQSGIIKENMASIKLHEKCGFRMVGIRERLGQSNGNWRDVALMEIRSKKIGN